MVPLEGNPWFIAVDCRTVPGIRQSGKNYIGLGADEVRKINKRDCTSHLWHLFDGTTSRLILLSESGLYKLIMRSDKPQARAFQEWVTREVLPTIPQRRRRLQDGRLCPSGCR